MGIYADQVLPRLTNLLLDNKEFRAVRARVASGLSGQVLEVGWGSGLNVPYYPAAVERVVAIEPAGVGRKLAARRLAASPVPVEFAGLDGADLPLASESIDHVLITWTMCTIPAVEQALAEMHRVLRPGGGVHFAEHGRAPEPPVAAWQDRLTPLQRRWAGGCHLNRPIADLVAGAGFSLTGLQTFYMKGPKPTAYMYEGVGIKA